MTNGIPEELAPLFTTSDSPVDLADLADNLQGLVQLRANPVQIEFTLEGEELTVRNKLLVYLLARKALKASGLVENERISPGEIERDTGWVGGSIRPNLSKLRKEKLVRLDKYEDGGGYFIPDSVVKRVCQVLARGGDT